MLGAEGGHDRVGGWIELAGGEFLMGNEGSEAVPGDGEGPVRRVTLSPFEISATAVSNREFAAFVEETGYVTEAERFGWSFVFHLLLSRRIDERALGTSASAPWWRAIEGASWSHPEGSDSTLEGREDHPVVHVSHGDATAYCRWARCRLPTEAQWEFAARGGREQAPYPWGEELRPDGTWRCNIFQGEFPKRDLGHDGHMGTAPVDAYAPNAFGLHNVVGNVWEWTGDWFTANHGREPRRDPLGAPGGTARAARGGSYLCHDSYCNRYRTSARMALEPESATGNVGFRVVRGPS